MFQTTNQLLLALFQVLATYCILLWSSVPGLPHGEGKHHRFPLRFLCNPLTCQAPLRLRLPAFQCGFTSIYHPRKSWGIVTIVGAIYLLWDPICSDWIIFQMRSTRGSSDLSAVSIAFFFLQLDVLHIFCDVLLGHLSFKDPSW